MNRYNTSTSTNKPTNTPIIDNLDPIFVYQVLWFPVSPHTRVAPPGAGGGSSSGTARRPARGGRGAADGGRGGRAVGAEAPVEPAGPVGQPGPEPRGGRGRAGCPPREPRGGAGLGRAGRGGAAGAGGGADPGGSPPWSVEPGGQPPGQPRRPPRQLLLRGLLLPPRVPLQGQGAVAPEEEGLRGPEASRRCGCVALPCPCLAPAPALPRLCTSLQPRAAPGGALGRPRKAGGPAAWAAGGAPQRRRPPVPAVATASRALSTSSDPGGR